MADANFNASRMKTLKMKKRYVIPMDTINVVPNSLETCALSPAEKQRLAERAEQRRSLNYIPSVLQWGSPKGKECQPSITKPPPAEEKKHPVCRRVSTTSEDGTTAITTKPPPPPEEEKNPPVCRRVSTLSEDDYEESLKPSDSSDSKKLVPLKKRYSRHKRMGMENDTIVPAEVQAKVSTPKDETMTKTPTAVVEEQKDSQKVETALVPSKNRVVEVPSDNQTTVPVPTLPRDQKEPPRATKEGVVASIPAKLPAKKRGYRVERTSPSRSFQHKCNLLESLCIEAQKSKSFDDDEEEEIPLPWPPELKFEPRDNTYREESKLNGAPLSSRGSAKQASTAETEGDSSTTATEAAKNATFVPGSTLAALQQLKAPPPSAQVAIETFGKAPKASLASAKTTNEAAKLSSSSTKTVPTVPVSVSSEAEKHKAPEEATAPGIAPPNVPPRTRAQRPTVPAVSTTASRLIDKAMDVSSIGQNWGPSAPENALKHLEETTTKELGDASKNNSSEAVAVPTLKWVNGKWVSTEFVRQNEQTAKGTSGSAVPTKTSGLTDKAIDASSLEQKQAPPASKSTTQAGKRFSSSAVMTPKEGSTLAALLHLTPPNKRSAPNSAASAAGTRKNRWDNRPTRASTTKQHCQPPTLPFVGKQCSPPHESSSSKPKPPPPSTTASTSRNLRLPPPRQLPLQSLPETLLLPASSVQVYASHGACVECVESPASASLARLEESWDWSETAHEKAKKKQGLAAFEASASRLLVDLAYPKSQVTEVESLDLVRKTIEVPKSAGTTWRESFLMSKQSFQQEVLAPFQEKIRARAGGRVNTFEARFVANQIELVGQPAMYDEFGAYFEDWLGHKIAEARYYEVLSDPWSLSIDVTLMVGAWTDAAAEIKSHGVSTGLWVDLSTSTSNTELWEKLLGEGVKSAPPFGIAITKTSGHECYAKDDLRPGENQVLSICVSRHLDLSMLDESRIVGNIYTMDGTLAMELEKANSSSLSISSGSEWDGAACSPSASPAHSLGVEMESAASESAHTVQHYSQFQSQEEDSSDSEESFLTQELPPKSPEALSASDSDDDSTFSQVTRKSAAPNQSRGLGSQYQLLGARETSARASDDDFFDVASTSSESDEEDSVDESIGNIEPEYCDFCKVCQARKEGKRIPHRAHHEQCTAKLCQSKKEGNEDESTRWGSEPQEIEPSETSALAWDDESLQSSEDDDSDWEDSKENGESGTKTKKKQERKRKRLSQLVKKRRSHQKDFDDLSESEDEMHAKPELSHVVKKRQSLVIFESDDESDNESDNASRRRFSAKKKGKATAPPVSHTNYENLHNVRDSMGRYAPANKEAPTLAKEYDDKPKMRRSLVIPHQDEFDGISDSDEEHVESEKKKGPARENSHNPNGAPAKLAFESFKKKMWPVYEIEFRRFGIHPSSAESTMWSNHKLRGFGTSCDENCPCVLSLPDLTSNVCERYLNSQMRKDPEWNPPQELADLDIDETPSGMSTNFAARFIPLLKSKYPEEGPLKTLDRLVFMWKLHVRQLNFGLQCNEQCCCNEGWQFVFNEGSMENLRPAKRRKRASAPLAPRPDNSQNIAPLLADKIPGKDKDWKIKAEPSTVQQPKKLSRGAFCFVFDPQNPLGFAVATGEVDSKSKATVSTCIVAAILTTAASKKALITTDTWVEAVEILGAGQEMSETRELKFLKSHKDLKLNYYSAKSKGATLRIWFVKPSAKVKTLEGNWDGGTSKAQSRPKTITLKSLTQKVACGGRSIAKSHGAQQAGQSTLETAVAPAPRAAQKPVRRVRFDDNIQIIAPISFTDESPKRNNEEELQSLPAKRQRLSDHSENPFVKEDEEDQQDDVNSGEWLLLYLKCCSSPTNEWRSQVKVEGAFFEEGGFKDKQEVRIARNRAHNEKLVEYGRQALTLPGCPVVPQSAKKEGFSSMSYLRLSAAGVTLLSLTQQQVKLKAEPDSLAATLTPKEVQEAIGAALLPMATDASLDLLRLFLRCLADERWTTMEKVRASFVLLYGTNNHVKFVEMLDLASAKSFVVWGRKVATASGDSVSVHPRPANHEECLESNSMAWFLRLTTTGTQWLSPARPPSPKAQPRLIQPTSIDLPVLQDKAWFVCGGSTKPCDQFQNTYACITRSSSFCWAKRCMYLHLQPPLGPSIDTKGLLFQPLHNVLFMEYASGSGETWFTSAYHDKEKNIYYKAEGGKSGHFHETDRVWWYPRKEDAKKAVERVHAAAQLHIKQIRALEARASKGPTVQGKAGPSLGHYGPAGR